MRKDVRGAAISTARQWWSQVVHIALVVLLVLVAKSALAEAFYVPSGSMEPTLLIGDALLASKFAYGYSTASLPVQLPLPPSGRLFAATPKRGDIVVFRGPSDPSMAWVKRVIGLPGDRLALRDGVVVINGVPVTLSADGVGEVEDETGASEPARRYVETLPGGMRHPIFKLRERAWFDDMPEVTVPADHVFVMGDNRDDSADSRVPVSEGGVGLLPMANLIGRVDAVVGSWDLALRDRPVWSWPSGLRLARFFSRVR